MQQKFSNLQKPAKSNNKYVAANRTIQIHQDFNGKISQSKDKKNHRSSIPNVSYYGLYARSATNKTS